MPEDVRKGGEEGGCVGGRGGAEHGESVGGAGGESVEGSDAAVHAGHATAGYGALSTTGRLGHVWQVTCGNVNLLHREAEKGGGN